MNDLKQKMETLLLNSNDNKSKTPNKFTLKENTDIFKSGFKLDNSNGAKAKPQKLNTVNPTEKKLQSMKYDFYIKNTIDTEIVGNSNVGVYKKINSPLIPENLKNKFSKVFKETIERRASVGESNYIHYQYPSVDNTKGNLKLTIVDFKEKINNKKKEIFKILEDGAKKGYKKKEETFLVDFENAPGDEIHYKERIQMMRNQIEQLINDNNILGQIDDDSIHTFQSFLDKKDTSEIKKLIDWDIKSAKSMEFTEENNNVNNDHFSDPARLDKPNKDDGNSNTDGLQISE
jgi:hypothetical protein